MHEVCPTHVGTVACPVNQTKCYFCSNELSATNAHYIMELYRKLYAHCKREWREYHIRGCRPTELPHSKVTDNNRKLDAPSLSPITTCHISFSVLHAFASHARELALPRRLGLCSLPQLPAMAGRKRLLPASLASLRRLVATPA